MKKISILLLVIFAAIAGTWVYQANKFEKIVKEQVFPEIELNELINTDLSKAVINKYKFSVTFADVTVDYSELLDMYLVALAPQTNYNTKSILFTDKVEASYSPIRKEIILDLNGDNYKLIVDNQSIYTKNPNVKCFISESLLKFYNNKQGPLKEEIYIKLLMGKNTQFIDDVEFASADSAESLFSIIPDNNYYKIKFNMASKQAKIDYLKFMSMANFDELEKALYKDTDSQKRNSEIAKILNILMEEPTDSEFSGSVKIHSSFVDSLGKKNAPYNPAVGYKVIKDIVGKIHFKNKEIEQLISFSYKNNEKAYVYKYKNNLPEEKLEKIWTMMPKSIKENDEYSNLYNIFNEMKNAEVEFNLDSKLIASGKVAINDLQLTLHPVKKEQDELKYEIKLSTPEKLLNSVQYLYNNAFRDMLQKGYFDKDQHNIDRKLSVFDIAINESKDKTYEFMSAFHNNNDFAKNKNLEINILMPVSDGGFKNMYDLYSSFSVMKINNRNLTQEFIKDQRIENYLQFLHQLTAEFAQ